MTITFSLYVIALLLMLFCSLSPKKGTFCFVSFLFPLLVYYHSYIDITSIPDLEGYSQSFEDIRTINMTDPIDMYMFSLEYKYEIGYMLFIKLCNYFFNFQTFLIFYACILICLYLLCILKYSQNIYISVLLFIVIFFDQSIFVLRQHLAIAIVLLSIKYIIKRDIIKFLIITSIAFLLHKSSIVWYFVYFVYGIKDEKKIIWIVFLSTAFFFCVFNNLSYINNFLSLGYATYINESEITSQYKLTNLFIIAYIFIIYYITNKKIMFKDGYYKLFSLLLILDLILNLTGYKTILLSRFLLYYNISLLFVIPMTYNKINNMILKYLYLLSIIVIFTYVNYFGSFALNMKDGKFAYIDIFNLFIIIMAGLFFATFIKNNFYKNGYFNNR